MHPDEVADCFINELNNPTWEVEQYININDENGSMIFENDIISTIEETMKGDEEVIGYIEYSEIFGAYVIAFPQYGTTTMLSEYIDMDLEIIGNVHRDYSLFGIKE